MGGLIKAIVSAREFKYGLLSLADTPSEKLEARRLAAIYIDADDDAKADCTAMLRGDIVTRETMRPNNSK